MGQTTHSDDEDDSEDGSKSLNPNLNLNKSLNRSPRQIKGTKVSVKMKSIDSEL